MNKSWIGIAIICIAAITTFAINATAQNNQRGSLQEARAGHKTNLISDTAYSDPPDTPPAGILKLVKYPSPAGDLAAYLTPNPNDGKKRPAIIWIVGGLSNGISSTAWEEADASNDQSASAFREAGIVMMYPSFRGGVGNPGVIETFYGEVDDVLAARDFLAAQPHVDADRIYLGGHSTGGTLSLLVAETTDKFRAIFSFGPVSKVSGYGQDGLTYDIQDEKEDRLRSPLHYLHAIRSPTFVIEGSEGNWGSLYELRENQPFSGGIICSTVGMLCSSVVRFIEIKWRNHFNILEPLTKLIAEKIIADTGEKTNIEITEFEAHKAAYGPAPN